MADAWGGSWGTAWGSSWGTAVAGEVALNANDVTSASTVSMPALAVEGEGTEPGLPTGGLSAGGFGYYRRRRDPGDEEEREKREERRRDLAHAIDRAIARLRTEAVLPRLDRGIEPEAEPLPEAGPPAPVAEIAVIDDGLAAVQDGLRAIEALGSRILEADAELAGLYVRARELAEEAAIADDNEALELLLTGTIEDRVMAVLDDEEEALELLLAA